MEPPTQEELRLEQIASLLSYLSDKAREVKKAKKEGKDVHKMIDVLEKDIDVAKSMTYAAYILAQNNEDPI